MKIFDLIAVYDGIFELLLGFALIFIGNLFMNFFRSGKNAAPPARVFFCMSFTFGISVLREMIQFFSDYFNEESNLQDYSYVPEENMLFFEIFGQGSAQAGQYHVMDTDLDFLCMFLGCVLGGGLLLFLSVRKAKKKAALNAEKEMIHETVSV